MKKPRAPSNEGLTSLTEKQFSDFLLFWPQFLFSSFPEFSQQLPLRV